MEITIRRAVPDDQVKLRPLQESIDRLHKNGRPDIFKDRDMDTSAAITEKLNNPDSCIFIAENADGEIAGYVFAVVIRYRNHSHYRDFDAFSIDEFCVSDKYRRRGIGKLLFDRCRAEALSLHCHHIDLNVWAFNNDAIAFYKALGMQTRMTRMELRL